MASAALLFSFSAVVFLFVLLQAPAPGPGHAVADLLANALDRFFLDGRGLMELATRRNMILLCHAILLLILRDAGVLGAPARRRSRSPPDEAATATTVVVALAQITDPAPAPARPHDTRSAVVVAQTACIAVPDPVPARTHATRSTVVWRRRRPRNKAVVASMHEHDAAGRVVECRPAVQAVATWAAPILATGPAAAQPEEAGAVATKQKQIVLAESPTPRNDDDDDDLLDRHDRAAAVEPLEHPTAIAADDGERDDCDDDRRIVAIATYDGEKRVEDQTPVMETEVEMELADDRMFEEFIESQRRQMRQESLRLVRSRYHYQAIATCY